MLNLLASHLETSFFKRHLLFLAATVVTVLFVGYNFGTFDEAMHIPFLKAAADPTLYNGDPMIGLHRIYYSYFWSFFVPVLRAGWLEPTLFVVHLATIYLTFWAVWDVSETLFHNALTSLLAVLGFIVPHFSFSGFPVFEFAPLSRTFVLPFLLIAVNQFFKGRVPLAFLIAGLMYNIHVVSVNFVMAMFGLACLLEWNRIGWKKILLGGGLFLLSALPVLLWKASGDPVDFTPRPEWVDFLNKTIFFHLFDMISPTYPETWVIAFGGVSAVILFFIALPHSKARPERDSYTVVTARNFMYAGIIVVLVDLFTVYFLPVTIIIQSQIIRVGLWILILSYLFTADYIAKLYEERAFSRSGFFILSSIFILSPTPILVLAALAFVKLVHNRNILRGAASAAPLVITITYAIVWLMGFWRIGIHIYGEYTPWVDVQVWARENTAKEARFITPPEKWGVQESDWRVHSERASVGTLSEILVAAFLPGYEVEWITRFEQIAPGSLAQMNGKYFDNIQFVEEAYYSLDSPALEKIACRYNAQYAVLEKPNTRSLPIAYENEEYTLYDLRQTTCP